MNGTFLLLTWGANPDSRDGSGDTPLLWLIKNKPMTTGSATQEIIKMLLQFGASPTLDNGEDGNSPLHVLHTVKKPDLRTCFIIYAATAGAGKWLKNKNGLTPYSVSSMFPYNNLYFIIY